MSFLAFEAGVFVGMSVGACAVAALYVWKPYILAPLKGLRKAPGS